MAPTTPPRSQGLPGNATREAPPAGNERRRNLSHFSEAEPRVLCSQVEAENEPGWHRRSAVIAAAALLGALAGCLFFPRLADRDLWSSHEARAGQNAVMIVQHGCWGLPKLFDGHPELQKPPLYYWLVAVIAHAQGGTVDAWAVRLPSALAALAGVLLIFGMLAWRGRLVAGFVAGAVMATALHYTWLARVGRIDMPLTLAVSTAVVCFYLADAQGLALRCLGYLAIAAAVMLKGPIGILLPASVLGTYQVLEGRLRPGNLLRSSLWWGVPLVLGVTLPWFWWVNRETHGEFFRVFFLHHNLDRGLGSADDLRVHPWWYYGPRWLIDFLPWSPLAIIAAIYLFRSGRWHEDHEASFGLVWFGAVFIVLSCAGFKRADYLLPAFPGAALLLGCVAEHWYQTSLRPGRIAAVFAAVVAACLVGWGLFVYHVLPGWEPALSQRTFAEAIRRHVAPPDCVHFFRAEAHALAFHLGYPIDTFLEWENLDIWAGRPGVHYIIMPSACAAEWAEHVHAGRLVEVLRNTDLAAGIPQHQRLVLMRTDNSP